MSLYNKKFWDEYRVQKKSFLEKQKPKPKPIVRIEADKELARLADMIVELGKKIDELIKKDEGVHKTIEGNE